ncbi:short-chain dehydrogenase/reductase-like protein SDR [Lophiotrema nucula]|uniref:Short-chain dehydrogenase/reductase-like protein SDR n=1 Tax=Lophiotrema nucula TaxID=690887 RepID=A0A6A5YRA8_9PLEO|nr:short-chain dehydrogenase/reductase-like protein SDR [Lophiotrema nucula]
MSPYTLPQDAVWFITGCSSGIGLALCTYLSTHTTSRIVATARNSASLSSLPDSEARVLKLALDVTSSPSIAAALTATLAKWGRIDVVVNNAGYGLLTDTETADLAKAREVMDTNFWGAVTITQLCLPILRDENPLTGQKGGVIVQVTSLGGRLAFAGNAFYHASKFALEGFTEAVSKEMGDDWGVHFCCVEPGGVKTRYAETSTSTSASKDGARERHPAYLDSGLATNVMRRYKESAEATRGWAEPEKVVAAIYGIVRDGVGEGRDIPLRVPLGSDSWGMQRLAAEQSLRDLEVVRSVSLSTSGAEQLASIDFLKK